MKKLRKAAVLLTKVKYRQIEKKKKQTLQNCKKI